MRNLLGMVALIAAMTITPTFTGTAHAAPDPKHVTYGPRVYSAPPAQESLKRPGCTGFYTTDTSHTDPFSLDKWVDMRTKIYVRQCHSPVTDHRWVDPVNVEFSYNTEGGSESCGFFDAFEGVRYHLYMQDGAGRNYAHPTVVLDCEGDTEGWTIESLAAAPNFRYCGGVPRWKTNWTVKIDNANDKSGTMDGILWNFTGPVRDECSH